VVKKRIIGWLGIGLVGLALSGCGGQTDPQTDPETAELLSPLAQLEQVVAANPDDTEALHALAVALHTEGRREEALTAFERLVEVKPDTRHLIELGVAYASLARVDDAENAFKRALESSIGHPVALHHLGNLAAGRGDLPSAISLYRQAVESDPQYLMAHFHLADALHQTGQFKDAYRSYDQVIVLDPKVELERQAFDAALLQMAGLDIKMGATERAVGLLEVLVAAVPDHPTAHLLLGQALMGLDRQDEARQELELHQRLAAQQTGSTPSGTEQVN